MNPSLAAGLSEDKPTFGLEELEDHLYKLLDESWILCFEFRRYPGGPCGKSIPASVFVKKGKDGALEATTIRAGFPCQRGPPTEFGELMRSQDFQRVSYLDVTGFKVKLALRSQILFPPVRVSVTPPRVSETKPSWGWLLLVLGLVAVVGSGLMMVN